MIQIQHGKSVFSSWQSLIFVSDPQIKNRNGKKESRATGCHGNSAVQSRDTLVQLKLYFALSLCSHQAKSTTWHITGFIQSILQVTSSHFI